MKFRYQLFFLNFLFNVHIIFGMVSDEVGNSFLMAVTHGNKEAFCEILDQNKEQLKELVNYQDPVTGDTACMLLAQGVLNKRKTCLSQLQNRLFERLLVCPGLDLSIRDKSGIDALGYSLLCHNFDAFFILLPYVKNPSTAINLSFALDLKNIQRDSILRALLQRLPLNCHLDSVIIKVMYEIDFPPLEILKK